jgi:hypothetical protein
VLLDIETDGVPAGGSGGPAFQSLKAIFYSNYKM